MKYKSYSVYDNEDFFDKYIAKRSQGKSPNELLEEPIMHELIGSVADMNILDLGCGDGLFGVQLLKKGAKHYYGIEGSKNMVNLADKNLKNHSAKIEHGDIENVEMGKSTYDLIVSRLVLHYIEDLPSLLNKIRASLKEGGEFIFSIEHPIITSCYEAYHQEVKRGNWIVDDYFKAGERVNIWIGKEVVKYHKPLEDYWRIIKDAGFEILELRESRPDKNNFTDQAEFARRSRIPLFLFFKLRK